VGGEASFLYTGGAAGTPPMGVDIESQSTPAEIV
jgi:hypothetical protein